jgi:hypothetical protein
MCTGDFEAPDTTRLIAGFLTWLAVYLVRIRGL